MGQREVSGVERYRSKERGVGNREMCRCGERYRVEIERCRGREREV